MPVSGWINFPSGVSIHGRSRFIDSVSGWMITDFYIICFERLLHFCLLECTRAIARYRTFYRILSNHDNPVFSCFAARRLVTGRFAAATGSITAAGSLCGRSSGIVGCMKTTALENKSSADPQEPFYLAVAFWTFTKRLLGHALEFLERMSTRVAPVLICWHCRYPFRDCRFRWPPCHKSKHRQGDQFHAE